MATRIDRMVRELRTDPYLQFFETIFGRLAAPGGRQATVDAVAIDGFGGAGIAQGMQGGDGHGMAVDLKKAA